MKRIDPITLRKSIEGEKIDLNKLGWSDERTDSRKLSYVRGYIWRKYSLRIKAPLDVIILFMIIDSLSAQLREDEN